METKFLCLLFGVSPSTLSLTIRNVLKRMIFYLQNYRESEIIFPDEEHKKIFANMIKRREPLVHNVIGFVDGLSILLNVQTQKMNRLNIIVDSTVIHE
jgi:hypothetical protein